jgi:uncharacterized protein (DUF1330 family)
MPKAYLFAELEITDPAIYEQYRSQVPATIAKYGGRYLVRGGDPQTLEGNRPLHRCVILEFDSPARLAEWYHSRDYAPLKELRQKSAKTHAFVLNGVEAP